MLVLAACGAPPQVETTTNGRPIRARPTFPDLAGGPVVVKGHVVDPGAVPWFRGMGLRFAILARGGILPSFDPRIEIRRRELGKDRQAFATYRSESEPEFELAPGDVVIVKAIVEVPQFSAPTPDPIPDPFEGR